MFINDADKLDQHFLIDEDVINKYLSYPKFNKDMVVLEIGAGKGVLTERIAKLVKKLYVIEIDKRLDEYLSKIDNVEVIYDNVLNVDIMDVDVIITSLPYSIIEPFIKKLVNVNFKEMYMLMGSNYVNHVLNKDINRLSLLTNSYFKMEKLLDVEPNSFDIPPRTMSTIVRMSKVSIDDLDNKYKIYRELFYREDKKLKNALMESLIKINNITKNEAKSIIKEYNINDELLDKRFYLLSNIELQELDSKLK